MPFLKPDSIDVTICSPPYFSIKNYGTDAREVGQSGWDAYLSELDAVWAGCWRAAKPGGVLIVNVRDVRIAGRLYPIGAHVTTRMTGWEPLQQITWLISNALPQPNALRERLWDEKSEDILVFVKPGAPHWFSKPRVPHSYADPRPGKQNPNGRCLGNVIRVPAYRPPNVASLVFHQAAWPDELVALLLTAYCPPGGTVLDPFLGSGTTLKVARHLGLRGTGVELDPGLLPLIERRVARESMRLPDWAELDAVDPKPRVGPRRLDLATGGQAAPSLFD